MSKHWTVALKRLKSLKIVRYSKFQLHSNIQFPVMGNLWFVRAIGCNVEPMVEPNHMLPANPKNHSNYDITNLKGAGRIFNVLVSMETEEPCHKVVHHILQWL